MLLLIVKDWSAEWLFVTWSVISATIGVICLAGGLFGWLLAATSPWQRVALLAAAVLLIKPGLVTDAIGLALLALVVAVQWPARRRAVSAPH
jgi:TRAP-type uncharacterized transport system fused permease subunit